MKQILFIVVLAVFVMDIVAPAQSASVITGFTIKNMAIYLVGLILISLDSTNGRLARISVPSFLFFVVFIVWTILSLIYVDKFSGYDLDFIDNARKAKTLIVEPILLFCMAFLFVESEAQGRRMLMLLVSIIGALNIFSIIASLADLNLFHVGSHYLEKARFTGLAANPNKTAYLLCVLIPLQYYLLITGDNYKIKWFLFVLILFEVLAILMTGSRGGGIAFVLEAFFISYLTKNMKKMIAISIILLPVAIISLMYLKGDILTESLNRIDVLIHGSLEDASSSRFIIWRALFEAYAESWQSISIGNGSGTVEHIGTGINAHNIYIQILLEYGLMGLLLFVFFIVSTYKYVKSLGGNENNVFRNIVMMSCAVVLWAWVFTTLIGILELICLSIGIGIALLQLKQTSKYTEVESEVDVTNKRIMSYKK